MKTELTAYTSTEKIRELTMMEPSTVTTMSMAITSLLRPLLSSQKQLITDEMPVINTIPQNTSKPVIISETDINPKKRERMPMVVFAELMQFSPVTDITITQLWFRILKRFYRLRRHMETMQRQTATAIFFVCCLLESTRSLAKVMTAIRAAPKTIEPKADLKSHLQAVSKQLLPSTLQYQKEHETAIVKTITQQKTKLKKSQMKNQRTVITPSAALSQFFLDLSSDTARMQFREYIQKKEKRRLSTTLIIGDKKTPIFSLRNCEAILTKIMPMSIFFLRHIKTNAYTKKMTKKLMAIARLSIMNPKMASPNRMAIESTIRLQIMTFGIILMRTMQRKLKTRETAKQATIQPAYCETQMSFQIEMLPFWPIQYAPPAMNAPRTIKKKTTQPTSLQLRVETGSERHSLHFELYSS